MSTMCMEVTSPYMETSSLVYKTNAQTWHGRHMTPAQLASPLVYHGRCMSPLMAQYYLP